MAPTTAGPTTGPEMDLQALNTAIHDPNVRAAIVTGSAVIGQSDGVRLLEAILEHGTQRHDTNVTLCTRSTARRSRTNLA